MPFTFEIAPSKHIVHLRIEGVLSDSEWLASSSDITTHPDFRNDFDHIVDISAMRVDSGLGSNLIARGVHDRLHGRELSQARLAIVASNHLSRAVARMYCDLVQDGAWVMIRIFDDTAAAEHWLRRDHQAA
ncbi:MAG: hypothetical protein ACPGU7_03785 [Gammaproteobacteria bacterium]